VKLNQQKVEDAVLAVLWLTLHDECRVWKGIDWDTMSRLHEKGYISDPARRAKSVELTEEGLSRATRLVEQLLT
jgi:predicted site-specific integrase-resolvase